MLSVAQLALASEHAQIAALAYELRSVPIEAPDQRTLDRYLRRPSYVRCDLVEFSINQLTDLVLRIDSGAVLVTDSSITFVPFELDAVRFVGIKSSTDLESGNMEAYEWIGQLAEQPDFKASFVINREKLAFGMIDTPEGVYRLFQSEWSENQFLCEIDPSFLPTRID